MLEELERNALIFYDVHRTMAGEFVDERDVVNTTTIAWYLHGAEHIRVSEVEDLVCTGVTRLRNDCDTIFAIYERFSNGNNLPDVCLDSIPGLL